MSLTDDRNTILKNYMIIRAVLGETGIFAQITREYPYVEQLFSLVLDEKLNLPFQCMTKEQKIDAWRNWSNTILYSDLTSERVFEIWSAWADKNEAIGFSHEQRLQLQKNGEEAKDRDRLKKMDIDEKCNVIYTLVYFSEIIGIDINILNGIEPLNLGVDIPKDFTHKDLENIASINLRNDERWRGGIRGRLPYGQKYKMIMENPLGIDFDKLKKAIASGIDKPAEDVKEIIEDAYSLTGIVKMICLNYENLYLDTSRYYIPDKWKDLLEIDKRRRYKICLKNLNIEMNMHNSIESVIKDIEKRDLGYLRPMTLTLKNWAKTKS